ncbi:MAG: class I SAM-dependent methyltransferase [Dehalococcoidales bacterium]|nr:class I SAM-dependent methyltransferase [Dehalococcoidales bacterium]
MNYINEIHDTNRKWWDVKSQDWQKLDEEIWNTCKEQSSFALDRRMQEVFDEFIGNSKGKKACVIASGDNFAVFALAGMGMKVTSTDISELRLNIARERAGILNLDIRFLQCDAADLSPVENEGYDLVISTPGTYVWISDLKKVYTEVCRVLKPGGYLIFHEIHPFTRPFKDQPEFEIAQPYFETGPYTHEGVDGIDVTTHNFYWMMSDFINALADSGLIIRRISEDPAEEPSYWEGRLYNKGGDERLLDWHVNPHAALPQWMVIVAQKPVA